MDRLPPLPLCPLTELPRLLCGCGTEGCDHFSMTEAEIAYIRGDFLPPDEPRRGLQLKNIPEYTSQPWSEPRDVKIVDSPVLCRVSGCTKPTGEQAFCCKHCLDDLEVALGDIPSLLEDLQVRFTRQDRIPPSRNRTRRRAEHTRWDHVLRPVLKSGDEDQGRLLASKGFNRVPYVPAAGAMIATLSNEVTTAIRILTESVGAPQPQLDAPGASRWLISHIQAIAADIAGPDIVHGILTETKRAMRMIDRSPESTYIGICDKCAAAMHADPNQPEHRCHVCGKEYVVEERKAEIMGRVTEHLLTVGQLTQFVGSKYVGSKMSRHKVNRLVAQGRLVKAGANRDGDALYRAADLLAIIEEAKDEPA